VGPGGIITTGTIGSGLALAADGTLSSTASGSPGGNSGAIQFNQGGAFDGTNDLIFNRTNRTLQTPAALHVGGIVSTNGVTNLTWTANTVLGSDTNKKSFSITAPNFPGASLRTDPFTGLPIWVQPIIEDEFDFLDSATVSHWNGTATSGGSATAGSYAAAAPTGLPRNDYNGFAKLQTFATNGVGATHFSVLRYNAASNQRWSFLTKILVEFEVGLETSMASNIVQIGFGDQVIGTNQTKCVMWEWNPQFYGASNWVVKTIGSSTLLYTNSLANINTWYKFGFKGDTNSIVFYTNGVPAFTNSTSSSMPDGTASLAFTVLMTNGKTNAIGTPMTHDCYLNYIHAYRY